MPLESYSDPPDANGFVQNWRVTESVSSDRVRGKLILRNNPYHLLAGRLGPQRWGQGYSSWCWKKAHSGADVPAKAHKLFGIAALEKRCYSKLRGKLYYGSASLGVNLAQMRQSREMIAARYAFLNRRASEVAADLLQWERRGRNSGPRWLERVAGFHLEVIFGWVPALSDIHAAAMTVIQLDDVRDRVSVSANNQALYVAGMDTWVLQSRVSYTTTVGAPNPNLWLLERAGLLNPATVAWDIVPWSFVVNMFVNTGQLVQSITDFAGLSFEDTYKTTTYKHHAQRVAPAQGVYSSMRGIDKRRAQSSTPPVPSLTFRLPDAKWETAAMAASLFTQRFGRIAGYVKSNWRAYDSFRRVKRKDWTYTE